MVHLIVHLELDCLESIVNLLKISKINPTKVKSINHISISKGTSFCNISATLTS